MQNHDLSKICMYIRTWQVCFYYFNRNVHNVGMAVITVKFINLLLNNTFFFLSQDSMKSLNFYLKKKKKKKKITQLFIFFLQCSFLTSKRAERRCSLELHQSACITSGFWSIAYPLNRRRRKGWEAQCRLIGHPRNQILPR